MCSVEPMMKVRRNNKEKIYFPTDCSSRIQGSPAFNVVSKIEGMAEKGSPVTNMKMHYQPKQDGPPELTFDIDLKKEEGEDERFFMTNQPDTEAERERRANERLCLLEQKLAKVQDQLENIRILRKEWNAQKVGLCGRRTKDPPKCNMNFNNLQ
ncbi:hypothetical protein RUM43_011095 [Polyplax serrata]|uniref:Uncharacterized protein n=1 Tax=Polyplax serrata TaxID=468196 RepID=A0AAN8NLH4_POLSC